MGKIYEKKKFGEAKTSTLKTPIKILKRKKSNNISFKNLSVYCMLLRFRAIITLVSEIHHEIRKVKNIIFSADFELFKKE